MAAKATDGPLVLVVDDDAEVRQTVADVLSEAGFRIATAASGEEGVAFAQAHRPALVVLDVMMREMDGYTALTRLRGDPATDRIPVIVLTGQEEPIYRTLSFGVGAVAHLTKPFSPARLTDTVQQALARAAGGA
jgi:CheY-like chemotaxis protein